MPDRKQKPVKILFDTDIGCDCDDAGALAVLHALADRNEAEIVAITHCTTSPYSAGCIDAINRYYGRPNLPVGTLKADDWKDFDWFDKYNKPINDKFPNRYPHKDLCPDAMRILRCALADAEDGEIVLVATGPMTNIALLLQTPPDNISPLDGLTLVTKKVKQLVAMAGYFREPDTRQIVLGDLVLRGEFNVVADIPAAQYVCEHWPVEMIFSAYEIGYYIECGERLLREKDNTNPVRLSYEIYCNCPRSSWDQTTMLYAVRPEAGYWDLHDYGTISIEDDGLSVWNPCPTGKHTYLVARKPLDEVRTIIDALMVHDLT